MKNAKEKKKRIRKGDFGYFSKEKKKRFLITLIMFAVPLFIFFSSWAYFDTRKTIWTVIAVVGCLPACKSMVSLIMILMRRPMDEALYESIRQHQGELVMSYEMYMTFYEKSAYIDAFAICGNTVVGYSSDPKIDCEFMARESQKIIRKNGCKDFERVKALSGTAGYDEQKQGISGGRHKIHAGFQVPGAFQERDDQAHHSGDLPVGDV